MPITEALQTQRFYPAVVKTIAHVGPVVEYYVLDPTTETMVRRRVRLQRLAKRLRTRQEVRTVAQSVADEINAKLRGGWSPLHETDDRRLYTPLRVFRERFLQAKEAEGCRDTTVVQYASVTSLWLRWCEDNGFARKTSGTYLRHDAVQYMDEVLAQQHRHRSYNNTLKVLKALFAWGIEHCYCRENPFIGFKTLKKEQKIRILVPPEARQKVHDYYARVRPAMNIVCQLVYSSAIRPAEILKIQLKHIDIERHCIVIPGENAKNHKTRYATLTPELVAMLREVLRQKYSRDFYLFGFNEELSPDVRAVNKSYFQKSWERMRNATGLPKEMQLYSLRDTGITDLLHAGIDPLTVRHHVDHSSQAIQDIYTDHFDEGVNERIYNSGVRF